MVPHSVFFVKGTGVHPLELISFELALRDAGIENFNLVPVSSICPPGCKIVESIEGFSHLSDGEIVFCVMARNQTNVPGKKLCASIGVAIPIEENKTGYLGEYCSFNQDRKDTAAQSQSIASTMLASRLGMNIEDYLPWPEKKHSYMSTGKISNIFDVTQSAEGDKNGHWTTVVAVAVFVIEKN